MFSKTKMSPSTDMSAKKSRKTIDFECNGQYTIRSTYDLSLRTEVVRKSTTKCTSDIEKSISRNPNHNFRME